MANCVPELLDDLAKVFATVRTWEGVIERKPGVFYVRNQPFLHFHLLAGNRRRADVKGCTHWVEIDLPRPAPARKRRTLLRELTQAYAEKVATGRARRRRPTEDPHHG